MLTAMKYTNAAIAEKNVSGMYQNRNPLPSRTPRAIRSFLSFLEEKLTAQNPTASRVTAIIPKIAAEVKNSTGKTEPPIGLSLGAVGAMSRMGPNKYCKAAKSPIPNIPHAIGRTSSRFCNLASL